MTRVQRRGARSLTAAMAVIASVALASPVVGQDAAASPAAQDAARAVYLDNHGVVRWEDTDEEVRLFGANYALPSSGDYRAAGYLTDDRKRLIDVDMAHFARMGWTGLRVAFWGDWQNADLEGNLIENDHLDLMDYLIARAKERGIYVLFNPIHTYDAGWPDAMDDRFPGFAAHTPKGELGTDPAAIAAQVNYVRQILEHVNPYTGVALADEPAILFVEMINEPTHHPEDLEGSVRYINALHEAVRSAGSDAITFHNVSQDFRIAEAIRRSKVQGASFGWYPTGLNAGRELVGSHLRAVDDYPPMRLPILEGLPKAVYEFDSADQLTATMYPAMARAYRAGGAQFAAMFAYDMLETASRNLGWQTHHLNLVYTPRKAMSAMIAAEAMRRLPRLEGYGPYPENLTFGPVRLDPDRDVAVLAASDAFLNAGATTTAPPEPAALRRVAGYGASPVVDYEGEGVYFLDKVRAGVWRLEVYPDAVPIDDPFEAPAVEKIVTRAIYRSWPMRIDLPDLGPTFTAQRIAGSGGGAITSAGAEADADVGAGSGTSAVAEPVVAETGRVMVEPGVYVLSADGPVDLSSLPDTLGRIGFAEYHAPAPDPAPTRVVLDSPPEHVAGRPLELTARVVPASPEVRPDSVTLWLASAARSWYRPFPMRRTGPYTWAGAVPADALTAGPYRYVVSVAEDDSVTTFPGVVQRSPAAWNFTGSDTWRLMVVAPDTPLRLLRPGEDAGRLSFRRIGDGWREGIFRIVPSDATGEPALHLELPAVDGVTPEDYTTSLSVKERIEARGGAIDGARALRLRLRGLGPRQRLHVFLVERDGTGWVAPVEVGPEWTDVTVPLSELEVAPAVNLPMGFPGHWNYPLAPAAGRGGSGDAVRVADVERLQLSLRREDAGAVEPGAYGVEIESATLLFD